MKSGLVLDPEAKKLPFEIEEKCPPVPSLMQEGQIKKCLRSMVLLL